MPRLVLCLLGVWLSWGSVVGTASAADAPPSLTPASSWNGGEKVLLVGEPIRDAETFWSEGAPFELPNSRIRVSPPLWKWSLREPCADAARCYFAGAILGPRGVTLEPDVEVKVAFAEYAAGRDPVLEAVLQRIAAASSFGVISN